MRTLNKNQAPGYYSVSSVCTSGGDKRPYFLSHLIGNVGFRVQGLVEPSSSSPTLNPKPYSSQSLSYGLSRVHLLGRQLEIKRPTMPTEREIASWPLACLKTCLRKHCELSFGFFSFSFYNNKRSRHRKKTKPVTERLTTKLFISVTMSYDTLCLPVFISVTMFYLSGDFPRDQSSRMSQSAYSLEAARKMLPVRVFLLERIERVPVPAVSNRN
jgi:hypothetical protein